MSGGSSTTTNQYGPGATAAQKQGNALLRALMGSINPHEGLSPSEKAYYGGELQRGVAESTASATTDFQNRIARMGGSRGAELEGLSDIKRAGIQGTAQGLSSLTGMDIAQKQQNMVNLLKSLGLALYPSPTGQTTSTDMGLIGALNAII